MAFPHRCMIILCSYTHPSPVVLTHLLCPPLCGPFFLSGITRPPICFCDLWIPSLHRLGLRLSGPVPSFMAFMYMGANTNLKISFETLHVRENVWYLFVWVWLILFDVIICSCLESLENVILSFLLMAKIILLCMYYILFICLLWMFRLVQWGVRQYTSAVSMVCRPASPWVNTPEWFSWVIC